MVLTRRHFFCHLLFLLTLALAGQNPFHKVYSSRTGFPCNTVYDVFQSKNGLIWMASDVGLFCYDGYDVKELRNNYPTDKALTNIFEDETGTIWCQSFKGVFYHTQGDSLVKETALTNGHGFFVAQILKGHVLAAATIGGVQLFDIRTKKYKFLSIPNFHSLIPSLNYKDTLVLNTQFDNLKYFVAANGFFKKTKNGNPYRHYFAANFMGQLISVSKAYPHNVLLGEKLITQLTFAEGSKTNINNIRVLSHNRLAVCTTNGLYIFDKNYQLIRAGAFFKAENISNIIEDTEGNYWLSTLGSGMIYTNQFGILIYHKDHLFEAMTGSGNTLYLAALQENTIFKLDRQSQQLDTFFHLQLRHKVSHLLYNARANELVFSNFHFNVLSANKKQHQENLSVLDIDTIDSKHYLVAHKLGLSIYPSDTSQLVRSWTSERTSSHQNTLLISNAKFSHAKYLNGKIYAANDESLYELTPEGRRLITFKDEQLRVNNLGVFKNELVVFTYNHGALLLKNNVLQLLYGTNNGLGKADLYLAKTFNNKLYFLLYDGYQIYDPATTKSYAVNLSDGVESDLIDFVVINDTTYATNYEGLLSFKLDGSLASKTRPRLSVNAIFVNDTKLLQWPLPSFSSDQNNFKITYSLIDYRGVNYTKVYYKINDGNWIETNAKNKELLFTALEPNDYSIQLKAVNFRGLESDVQKVAFTICPPFYKTWWFIFCAGLVFILIVLLSTYYRITSLKKKQKTELEKERLLHELDLSNLKSLRSQMNPHFLYNALNAIQSFIYTGNKETAVTSLGIFSDLSRGVLESSRNSEISLHDELQLIENYLKLETMRLPRIRYQLIVDPKINRHDTYIPTMIIQPLLENAFYHGLSNKQGEGLLNITFTLLENKLEVIIEDDGIGRAAAAKLRQRALKKSAAFSTHANLSRIDLLNAKKEDKISLTLRDLFSPTKEAAGTRVTLIIPINEND